MAFKLVISDRVEFDVKFSLNDGGKAKAFGLRLAANRALQDQIDAEFQAGTTVGDFLKARDLAMLGWIGLCPMEDEGGAPVAAGPKALQAAMDLIPHVTGLIYAAFLQANGAQGKSGN